MVSADSTKFVSPPPSVPSLPTLTSTGLIPWVPLSSLPPPTKLTRARRTGLDRKQHDGRHPSLHEFGSRALRRSAGDLARDCGTARRDHGGCSAGVPRHGGTFLPSLNRPSSPTTDPANPLPDLHDDEDGRNHSPQIPSRPPLSPRPTRPPTPLHDRSLPADVPRRRVGSDQQGGERGGDSADDELGQSVRLFSFFARGREG